MEAKVDPTSGLASIMQYCFPSTLFGGDPYFFKVHASRFTFHDSHLTFPALNFALHPSLLPCNCHSFNTDCGGAKYTIHGHET